jgi:hypothetical protein
VRNNESHDDDDDAVCKFHAASECGAWTIDFMFIMNEDGRVGSVDMRLETPVEIQLVPTSSRRVSCHLLAVCYTVVEVEFAIRVQDAAALIANDGLTEAKLNTEFAKQVFPRFCVLWQSDKVCFACCRLRCAGESQQRR